MKTMKFSAKFGAFILCVSMVLSLCTVFAFGAESEELSVPTTNVDKWDGPATTGWHDKNPDATEFTLNSAEDLKGFANLVNGGNSFAGKTITLNCNVILNEGKLVENPATDTDAPVGKWEGSTTNSWTPIGRETAPFSGIFDGNGNTVWGVYHSGSEKYTGFFAYISSATVKNLTATGKVYSKYTSQVKCALGGLIAYAQNSTITNCTNGVYAQLLHTANQYGYVGGVVGYAYGTTTVTSCVNLAGVNGKNSKNANGAHVAVGGVVGYAEGTSGSVKTKVSLCENKGQICAQGTFASRHARTYSLEATAGGVVGGMLYANMDNCVNYGMLHRGGGSGFNISGGVAGMIFYNVTISGCINYGSVAAGNIAGGIVGSHWLQDKGGASDTTYVKECYNYGSVISTKAGNATFAAGICGQTNGQSSKRAPVEFSDNVNAGNVSGKYSVAGIVNASVANSTSTIKNCTNMGTLTALFTGNNDVYVSGIAFSTPGANTNMNMSVGACVNVGAIAVEDDRADTTAETTCTVNVGGICASTSNPAKIADNYYLESEVIIPDTLTVTGEDKGTNAPATSEELTGGSLAGSLGWYQGIDAPLPTYEAYIAEAKVRGASVGLADALSVSFYILNKGAMKDLELVVSCANENGEIISLTKTEDGDYLRYTATDVAAVDMDTFYTVKVQTAEGETVSELSYSILTYAVNKYATADQELRALLEAMMYYGNAAQANKGEATLLAAFAQAAEYAVNETYVEDNFGNLELHKIANEGEDLAWIADGTVALKLDEYVRPFLQVDGVASVTVDFNGVSDTPCEETSSYFIIDCLYAPSLEDGFCIKAYDENGDFIGQITYSVATYVLNLLEDEDATDTEMTLAKALAVYMNQAKVYKLSH